MGQKERIYHYMKRPSWYGYQFITKEDLLRLAAEEGPVELTRYDRELGKMVTDIVTADMPEDEIII